MMHPDTELRYINDVIGIGIVATKLIPKGTIIWISDDLDMTLKKDFVESLDETRRRMVDKYSYLSDDGDYYILHWDHARYMNHSFHPTCIDTIFEFNLAARDIYPGEQLTCDYGIVGVDEDFECVPEEGTSRTRVRADDYLYFSLEWDEMAREAFKYFNSVKQPLKHLIKEEYAEEVKVVAAGLLPLPSILTLFVDESDDDDDDEDQA